MLFIFAFLLFQEKILKNYPFLKGKYVLGFSKTEVLSVGFSRFCSSNKQVADFYLKNKMIPIKLFEQTRYVGNHQTKTKHEAIKPKRNQKQKYLVLVWLKFCLQRLQFKK
jgi:hypothetical protein